MTEPAARRCHEEEGDGAQDDRAFPWDEAEKDLAGGVPM